MKNLIMFFALLFLPVTLLADEMKPLAKAEYEKAVKNYTKAHSNFNNPEFYKNYVFKNKKTGEIVNFEKLGDFEKQLWYIIQVESITDELKKMETKWKLDVALAKNKPDDDDDDDDDEDRLAWKEEIEEYVSKIHELRKKTAVKFEALVEKVFTDYADKLPEEEKEFYLKKLREAHDKENLIERKK